MNIFNLLFIFFCLFTLFLASYYFKDSNLKQNSQNIIIIEIDDYTLSKLNSSYVEYISDVMVKLNQSKIIILDFIFTEKNDKLNLYLKENYLNLPYIVAAFKFNHLDKYENEEYKGSKPFFPDESYFPYFELGYANMWQDTDGKIRRIPLNLSENYSSMIGKAYSLIKNEMFNAQEINIDYCYNCIEKHSFYDALYENIDFDEKIVFVGVNSKKFNDLYYVPYLKNKISGVEIQAQALNTMLSNN